MNLTVNSLGDIGNILMRIIGVVYVALSIKIIRNKDKKWNSTVQEQDCQ